MRVVRALFTAGILALTGCAGAQPDPVHVEILASTAHQAENGWNVEARSFRQALDISLVPGTHVAVAPISDRSITEDVLVDATIPPFSLFGLNGLQEQQLIDQSKVKCLAALRALHARTTGKDRTEIIAAVTAAADRFENDGQPNERRTLLILSTGFEQSSTLNMADYGLDMDAARKSVIRRLRAQNALPRLRGVHVCFAGATSGRNNWADPRRFLEIKRFWNAFFAAAGAHVDVYAVGLEGCRIRG